MGRTRELAGRASHESQSMPYRWYCIARLMPPRAERAISCSSLTIHRVRIQIAFAPVLDACTSHAPTRYAFYMPFGWDPAHDDFSLPQR